MARFVEAVFYLEEQMDTKEVKANLNTVVQYNGVDYMFQGCIIRKNTATNGILLSGRACRFAGSFYFDNKTV